MAPPVNQQYIVDEKWNPTAVILPIKDYKEILSVLEEKVYLLMAYFKGVKAKITTIHNKNIYSVILRLDGYIRLQ